MPIEQFLSYSISWPKHGNISMRW